MGATAFWDDLAKDLEDPEFLREFVVESVRIATIDQVVNALDDARQAAGLSKAALARAISQNPALIRRLFSAGHANPLWARSPRSPQRWVCGSRWSRFLPRSASRSRIRCWRAAAPTHMPSLST